jgi:hypothetical protein
MLRSPSVLRDDHCAHGLLHWLDEDTLHERDNRPVISGGRDRALSLRALAAVAHCISSFSLDELGNMKTEI